MESKSPAKSRFIDDDGDDEGDGESFWDDAVKYAKSSSKPQHKAAQQTRLDFRKMSKVYRRNSDQRQASPANDEQLWVVQYGEVDRRSLVEAKVC